MIPGGFVDLSLLIPRLEALAGILLAPPPPAALQQGIAEQLRQLVENIAALPGSEAADTALGWIGISDGSSVDALREGVQISGVLDAGGQVLWADLHGEDGTHWHCSFEALTTSPDAGGALSETRALIEISAPGDSVSSTQFTHDGRVMDCLDPEAGLEAAAEHLRQSLETLDEGEDGEYPGDGTGLGGEEGAGAADSEGGFDLPGGAMGGRILRGAVAGLAGAAVAGAAAAARKKRAGESPEKPESPPAEPVQTPPVAEPAQGPVLASPAPAPVEPGPVEWHYVSMGEKYGPIAESDLRKYLAGGNLSPDTLVWRPGLEQWSPAREIPELADSVPIAPQPPPVPSPSEWFYGTGAGQAGPVPEAHLKAWLANGQLSPQTLVWKAGMQQWLPAASIPELWS